MRARPVADAPVEALVARAEELAKRWLIAAIEAAPLHAAPGIATDELVGEAPAICAALARALASDRELDALEARRATRPDLLQAVVWRALRAELPDAAAEQVWELGDRLACAIEVLRAPLAPERAWPDALEAAIAAANGRLAVLLVVLDDADRVATVETGEEARAVYERFAGGVGAALRRGEALCPEDPGRVWVIAPGSDGGEGQALGSRIVAALHDAEPWRGAPLGASVGVAALGEDGDDAATLIEAAEQRALSAAASGISIVRPD